MAVTLTRADPASARRCVRPMRPAPINPSRNCWATGSESALDKVCAVGALVGSRLLESLFGAWEAVLLHDEPALIPDTPQVGQDAISVQVPLAQRREDLALPDLAGWRAAGNDGGHNRTARILEMNLVDARTPRADGLRGFATADEKVARI